MNSELSTYVQKYVKYDDYIKKEEDKLKQFKKQKELYSKKILENMVENKISQSDIKIGNSKIFCKEHKTMTSINHVQQFPTTRP